MSEIWKYELIGTWVEHDIPAGADIIDAQIQAGHAVMWAVVEPGYPKVRRRFRLFPTGHMEFDQSQYTYIATLQYYDDFVLHLFEEKR